MAEKTKEYINWYKSGFQKFEDNLNGQSESIIHNIRKDAFAQFTENGFPTTKIEEWKYTNVESIANANFNLELKKTKIQKSDIEKFFIKDLDCFKLVFVNGCFESSLSDSPDNEKDFIIENLQDYLQNNSNTEPKYLTKIADYKTDSFVALSTAFIQNGILIKINNDKIIEKPFFLLFISDDQNQTSLSQPRILFESGTNSKATLIESYQSIHSENGLCNVVSELYLAENARLEHIKIQNQSEKSFHVSNLFARLERNSHLKTFNINLGGRITRNNIITKLAGEGSESVLNGVYIGNGDQHIDNRTIIDHEKPNCLSTETYKGIVGDKARGVFNGKIHVYPDAQKTNAIQNNSGLLLSENASIDTKPQLEIYADDVRCTHGATIGQLDEEALFYLRSRGIGIQNAKKMLIGAFAGEVTDQINSEIVKNEIQEIISEKLKMIT
jgi:Fe-S cluster assembly protein SufD